MPQRSVGRQVDAQRKQPAPVACRPIVARTRRGAIAWRDGLSAEQLACDALRAEGWEILARRARTASGEIDIVARRIGMLAFVEVKTRATLRMAASSLSERQQRRLRAAAGILLAAHPHWCCDGTRFDLMLVDPAGTVRRIADAFRQETPEDRT